MAYQFSRAIIIDHTKCGTQDSTLFPFLFYGQYAYLKTTGNGGNVQSASGFDIGFYSDSALTQKLPWETVSWSGTTGFVYYWVLLPYLSATFNTTIYIAYGDSSITSDQSNRLGVWVNNFGAVWHLQDNAASTAIADATGNTVGVCSVNTNGLATVGQFGTSLNFATTSDYITVPMVPSIELTTTGLTISMWINASGGGAFLSISTGASDYQLSTITTDLAYTQNSINISSSLAVLDSTWHYVSCTIPIGASQTITFQKDASFGTTTANSPTVLGSGNKIIGANKAISTSMAGLMQEARIASVVRSTSWLTSEYNNQNSPSTFYALSNASILGSYDASVTAIKMPTTGAILADTPVPFSSGNTQPEFGQS